MVSKEVVVNNGTGLHARPAGVLVKKAGEFSSKITLEKDEKAIDAKRLLAVLSLCAKQGDELTITVEGSDEDAALEAVKAVIEESH